MSTSANPAFASLSPAVQVNLHVSLKIAQTMGMIVPPLYLVACLARHRPLTVRGLMKTSTNSTVIGGIVGYGIGAGYLRNEPEEKLVDRVVRLKHNAGQVRTDDYSIIGAAVGGLLSPAIFLHRAPMVLLVSGGAGIGLGAGVWVHLFQSLTKGEDIKPEAMVDEITNNKP